MRKFVDFDQNISIIADVFLMFTTKLIANIVKSLLELNS